MEFLRNQANIPNNIGYDLSFALTYRPLDTQNVMLRGSAGALAPGQRTQGALQHRRRIAFSNGNFLYSVLFNLILTY